MFVGSSSSRSASSSSRSAIQTVPRTGASGNVSRPVMSPIAELLAPCVGGSERSRGQWSDHLELEERLLAPGHRLDGLVELLQLLASDEERRLERRVLLLLHDGIRNDRVELVEEPAPILGATVRNGSGDQLSQLELGVVTGAPQALRRLAQPCHLRVAADDLPEELILRVDGLDVQLDLVLELVDRG